MLPCFLVQGQSQGPPPSRPEPAAPNQEPEIEPARRRWDCEQDGYDDDSNPLPKFKSKFEQFTAAIKAGCTPPWP